MPRLRRTAEEKLRDEWAEADRRLKGQIYAWLGMTGHTLEELGEMMGLSRGTMYNRRDDPGSFRLEELRKLRSIIGGEVTL